MKTLAQIKELMVLHNAPYYKLQFFENDWSRTPSNGGANTHQKDVSIDKAFEDLEHLVKVNGYNNPQMTFMVHLTETPSGNQGKLYGPYKFKLAEGGSSSTLSGPETPSQTLSGMLQPHIDLAKGAARNEVEKALMDRDRADFERDKAAWALEKAEKEKIFESKTEVARQGMEAALTGVLPHILKGLGGMFGQGAAATAAPLAGAQEPEEAPSSEEEKRIFAIGDQIIGAFNEGYLTLEGIDMIATSVNNTLNHLKEDPNHE